jgi:phage terminase large subunit GpA-like protein
VRNEALDCRGYATAALHALYMGGFKLADQVARMKAAVTGKPNTAPAYQVYRSKFLAT